MNPTIWLKFKMPTQEEIDNLKELLFWWYKKEIVKELHVELCQKTEEALGLDLRGQLK